MTTDEIRAAMVARLARRLAKHQHGPSYQGYESSQREVAEVLADEVLDALAANEARYGKHDPDNLATCQCIECRLGASILALAAAQQSAERYAKECDRLMTEVPAAFQRQLAAAQRERDQMRDSLVHSSQENARLRARGERLERALDDIAARIRGYGYTAGEEAKLLGGISDAIQLALGDGGAREEETTGGPGCARGEAEP